VGRQSWLLNSLINSETETQAMATATATSSTPYARSRVATIGSVARRPSTGFTVIGGSLADSDVARRARGRDSYGGAMSRSLVVKVTAGDDAPERCAQGFTVAAVAAGAGVPVSLWLTGEAAWFALPGRAEQFELPHSAPLADLLKVVLAAGTVTLCVQCALRRGIDEGDLLAGMRIAGAATFVSEALADNAQALVY